MAIMLGKKIPGIVLKKIRRESNKNSNEVALLCSEDSEGFPNASLLSYLDLAVISPSRVLLAIGEESSTKRNLLRNKKGTIVMWAGMGYGIYYIKGRFNLVKSRLSTEVEGFRASALICSVQKVSKDYVRVAEIKSTITYEPSVVNESHVMLFKELKGIARSL